jgi:hypothetical protein
MEDPPVGWTPKRCQDYFREFEPEVAIARGVLTSSSSVPLSSGWAKNVTDLCIHSLPLIQIPLDEIYFKRHFVLDGKAHKCHPDLGGGKVSEDEERKIKGLIDREKREKRKGWESPLYT